MVSISLSDENTKILVMQQQQHLIKSKIIEEWPLSPKWQSNLSITKKKIRPPRPFVRTAMVSITFYGEYLIILEL